MKRTLQVSLFLLPMLFFGQEFLPMDTISSFPAAIKTKVKKKIERVIAVDFTGDNIKDYIVQTETDKNGMTTEYWLTSNFKILSKRTKYVDDFDYTRFINLDDDPQPEIYSVTGYVEGVNYAIYKLDLKTGELKPLFYFNPVIVENNKYYWGYNRDMENLLLRNKDGVIQLCYTTKHRIARDDFFEILMDQTVMPVIFLTGHSTQKGKEIKNLGERTWATLEQITNRVRDMKQER